MYKEIIDQQGEGFGEAVEHFKGEIEKFRTGRATPALVDYLVVDYYGTKTPMKQIASINVPEPRSLMIQPWDRGALSAIETAIRSANIGLNPMNDGVVIRIALPPLTEERRRELVKALNQKAEEARIAVRNIREDVWKEIQNLQKEGLIAEDDKFRAKEELQEVVELNNKKIEELRKKKEEDMMTV
ncbi:MAG: ribosome recycling factor [Candidatus Moranbacteria bacterium]|nr:ribosome recycling factor [Candidatus Moranbacteria bacterium]